MKYLRHSVFILCIVFLLGFSVQSDASDLSYQTKILPNGMRLVYRVLPDSPTTTMRFAVPVGFLTEPKELGGISHLLEHLIYRGNANYTAEEFKRQTVEQGGYYNGSTGMELTEYHAEVPSEDYLSVFTMYTDMILNPGLSEKDVALEKKIVMVEKALKTPGNMIMHYFSNFTDERYNYNVKAITRQDVFNYHQQYYRPNVMTVIITGAFDPKEVIGYLSTFGEKAKPETLPVPEWLADYQITDVQSEDYLQNDKYRLIYGFDLKEIGGRDLVVAKLLPYLLTYDNRNYDNVTNRPLDYDIFLFNRYNRLYLLFMYRDYLEPYNEKAIAWHQKNLDRYFKFLKAKNFNKFIKDLTGYYSRYYDSLIADSTQLNDYYYYSLFDPTMLTEKDLSTARGLSSGDFKRFVEKNLEGQPYHKVVITAKETKEAKK